MEASRPRLVLMPGGKADDAPDAPSRARALRVLAGGPTPEVEEALAEAVEAARQMRLEIERRIARALEGFEDRGETGFRSARGGLTLTRQGGHTMSTGDEDKLHGKWDDSKGRAKKAWGEVTDNPDKKAEGTMDKVKGKLEDVKGNIKNKIDDIRGK
jgi:uncharacterized protein YjbJ (UPF0337 family)